ncbi:MAG: B12-binding domain-containing radical SAM protein [Firmicutes bacterium]|nr:B12-binding domain-containing radical SAM protein [Bacillota bacterium]
MAIKILLTTLNAKFIHSSLALRYLYSSCRDLPVEFRAAEFDINQELHRIYGDILGKDPEVVAFSCYIWNIEPTLKLVHMLKQVRPSLTTLLGGPEVSYDPGELMANHPAVDYIIFGEGEATFREFLQYLVEDQPDSPEPEVILGLAYRRPPGIESSGISSITVNPPRPLIQDLDSIPSPFCQPELPFQPLDELRNKIVYYESSRGCPFGCRYCLSSLSKGVRNFSLDRVKSDLQVLVDAGVKQVKFVDRTFNIHRGRALEILRFLGEKAASNGTDATPAPQINFHFEIAGDLLDDAFLDFLTGVPPGLFQFEIGVQSTNPLTLALIDRKTDLGRLKAAVRRLKAAGNIHLHLDLIAGLPGEDYASFQRSFDKVFELRPERLQLGFLKLLKGSSLREHARNFGCIYAAQPPYEVLATDVLRYDELLRLKRIEDLLEKYYNSHHFDHALEFLFRNFFPSPFKFFEAFSAYWEARRLHQIAHRLPALYRHLYDFAGIRPAILESLPLLRELLRFDYLLLERYAEPPEWLTGRERSPDGRRPVHESTEGRGGGRPMDGRRPVHVLLHDQELLARYLPDLAGLPIKEIARRIRVESFAFDLFPDGTTAIAGSPPRQTLFLIRYDLNGQDGHGPGERAGRYTSLDL